MCTKAREKSIFSEKPANEHSIDVTRSWIKRSPDGYELVEQNGAHGRDRQDDLAILKRSAFLNW